MQEVRDVMTAYPLVVQETATILDAARAMADANVGSVLVVDSDEALFGLVTDRDIVTRAVVTARGLEGTTLRELCTEDLATVAPSDTVIDALEVMRENAVRRVPVVLHDKPVGIMSLGDVAVRSDELVAPGAPGDAVRHLQRTAQRSSDRGPFGCEPEPAPDVGPSSDGSREEKRGSLTAAGAVPDGPRGFRLRSRRGRPHAGYERARWNNPREDLSRIGGGHDGG